MAETLRELVVALSLDSSNFSRNMRSINQQIKEAESTFRLAGAGVENFENCIRRSMSGNRNISLKIVEIRNGPVPVTLMALRVGALRQGR